MVTMGEKNAARMNSTPVVTEVRPVRPPSAAPEVDSTKVVMEETPMKPPTAAAAESTIRISLISSTLPSSVRNSPCLATAIAVPMVSKKSLMSSENEMTRSAGSVRTLTMAGTPPASAMGPPMLEKSSGAMIPVGAWVTPRGIPAMTATTMPMSSEPGTLRQARATVTRMEMMPTMKVGEVMSPRPTSVPAPAVIMPASHRPIMAMNRPRPTEMA